MIEGINIRADHTEERISELEDRLFENAVGGIKSIKINEERLWNSGVELTEQTFRLFTFKKNLRMP